MTVGEAKNLILQLVFSDITSSGVPVLVEANATGQADEAKFLINGKLTRVVSFFSGWHVPINLDWFHGSYDQPQIQGSSFYWYAFAIPTLGRLKRPHYLICDYLQMREWVLEFEAPLGRDHRDHYRWRADILVDRGVSQETQAYFRWGDEPKGQWAFLSRVVLLDNIAVVANQKLLTTLGKQVGAVSPTGESEAHRRLKLFIAREPQLIGLSAAATGEIEHPFCTGDRVDVLFSNHGPKRAVVEIELDKEPLIIIGIHQAIKYRGLAAAESRLPIRLPDVAAHLVCYGGLGATARDLAKDYDVSLLEIDRNKVLAPEV
jgi:hypothetical protein